MDRRFAAVIPHLIIISDGSSEAVLRKAFLKWRESRRENASGFRGLNPP
jgi:hypothetical protein